MIAIYTIVGAVLVLALWAGILWIGARLDRKYLQREEAERVYGDREDG
ncbi:hypothetical protein [Erythrobacter ani]|uniref:CcmD family protein n=1 Tax=Erythrobacter ani TaxID=2827235 RepID=A0ABS6SRA2_9SPHN|nr:hypothetical protein [Erythrobacter ani]MBV7266972.1 hypothetical protein [Erythrobacter ani]